MKLSELKQYLDLKSDETFYEVEICRLKNLKNEQVSYYPTLTGGGSGGGVSSPTERIAIADLEYGEKINEQIKQAKEKLKTIQDKLKMIEEFVENIQDSETKAIMRKHIYQNVSYRQLARERFVSRNYIAKKVKKVCEV